MTPIKCILIIEAEVFAVDFAGKLNLIARCTSAVDAHVSAVALGTHHKVDVYEFNSNKMEIERVYQ